MKSGSRPLVVITLIALTICSFGCKHKDAEGGATDKDSASPAADAGDAGAPGGNGHKHHKGSGASGGANAGAAPAIPVQTQEVKSGTVSSIVQVTGNVTALHDIQVAAKTSGGVLRVNFREGDLVKKGQVVVEQDTTDLQATVNQDRAQIASDQAKLDQARENYLIQVTQAKQNVLNAQATLNAAAQNYHKLKNGNRPEDILQAEATSAQTKSARDIALITLNRDKELYPQGAIAKSTLDLDQSTYDSDQQLYLKAVAAEKEEKIGYQVEDVRSAEEAVREQQANVKNQIANQRLIAVQRGAVESAQAVLAQDHAKMTYDQTQVSYAIIRSPIDGIVAARETEPGQIATGGTSLMRIVNIDTLYYQPTISETDWQATHNGDAVKVTVDALPGMTFPGHVAALYPAADTTTRVFSLRVYVDNPTHIMRPGMFARGNLITKIARNVPVVPTSALVTAATQVGFEANNSSDAPVSQGMQLPAQQVVVLKPDNTVEVRPVTLGIVTMDQAQIKSGLAVGDQIVVVGQQGLKSGQKVTVNKTAGATQVAAGD